MSQQDLLRALDELEAALEEFRVAHDAFLARGSEDAGSVLARALEAAEARLDAARSILANAADERSSYPS